MIHPTRLSVLVFCIYSLFAGLALSQEYVRDPAKEEPFYRELRTKAPKVVEKFKTATEALDSRRFDDAIRDYEEVLKQAPDFDPALRRYGHSLMGVGKREEGLAKIQQALDRNRNSENLLSMAWALVEPGSNDYRPPDSELEKSLALAKEASYVNGNSDSDGLVLIAQLTLQLNRMEEFRNTASLLKAEFPDSSFSYYFNGIKLAEDRDFDSAIAEIKTAESLGLDPEESSRIISAIEAARIEAYPLAPYLKYIYGFLVLVFVWMMGLLGLFLGGKYLSTKTLKAIEESDPNDLTGGGHASLKANYRRLITLAGVYYYLSQPMVAALLIAVTLALIVGSFMVGTIPVGFLIGLIFVGAGSIFFMGKSLIFRPKVEDPGRVLEKEEAPHLVELVRSVAEDISTRPIDEIRVTPGVELAVYERGSYRQKMQDKGERILIIGAGSLNNFSTNAFRAVLAHEYGHFSNRDTAGGDVAFRVNSDMVRLAEAMVNSGTNTYHNLAFHFLRLYHFIFRRITHGASRMQEVLADRVAVHTYGSAAFCEGLTHVFRQGVVFDKVADAEISSALADRRKFNNIYELKLTGDADETEIESAFRTEFERETTEDDTHPSGIDRVQLAEKITGQTHGPIDGMVWDLFADREAFTNTMILMVEQQIRGERYKNYHDIGIASAGD